MKPQLSVGLYRSMTALYPKSFRREYRQDLVAAFTQQMHDDHTAKVWLCAIRDLFVTIPTQHLEAKMNRPTPQTVAVIATCVAVAALVLAVVAGTGPVVGVFLSIAVSGLVVATLAWQAARPVSPTGVGNANHWRTIMVVGGALVAAVIVLINLPPYNNKDLPEPGWVLMMVSLVTGVGMITVGLTIGVAQRSARHATTG